MYGTGMWPDSETTKLLYQPKQKPARGWGLRQIPKHLPPNPFTGQVCKKRRPLGFGVFILNWSIPVPYLFEGEKIILLTED